MKIDELIDDLQEVADGAAIDEAPFTEMTCRKAAETISLLWEIAKNSSNAKYKRQIDEWRGDDAD